ncbi:hypothetical protein [Streptomyces uncialis]
MSTTSITVPEHRIVETLLDKALRLIDEPVPQDTPVPAEDPS